MTTVEAVNITKARQAQKDLQKLKQTGLTNAAKELIAILKNNPFQNPPPFEKLVGNLAGKYSRRLNIKHRLVYMVTGNTVIILRMWSYYDYSSTIGIANTK